MNITSRSAATTGNEHTTKGGKRLLNWAFPVYIREKWAEGIVAKKTKGEAEFGPGVFSISGININTYFAFFHTLQKVAYLTFKVVFFRKMNFSIFFSFES